MSYIFFAVSWPQRKCPNSTTASMCILLVQLHERAPQTWLYRLQSTRGLRILTKVHETYVILRVRWALHWFVGAICKDHKDLTFDNWNAGFARSVRSRNCFSWTWGLCILPCWAKIYIMEIYEHQPCLSVKDNENELTTYLLQYRILLSATSQEVM